MAAIPQQTLRKMIMGKRVYDTMITHKVLLWP
jgi:hypothetical protein